MTDKKQDYVALALLFLLGLAIVINIISFIILSEVWVYVC